MMNIGSYKSNIKFQLLQRFVPHLITEIKEHDRSYVPPAARTNNAMMLFPQRVCATITEPAAGLNCSNEFVFARRMVDS